MMKQVMKRWTSLVLTCVMVLGMLPAMALPAMAATTKEVAPGVTASGDFTEVTGGIQATATVSSSSGCSGTSYTENTVNVTLRNTKGNLGALSFNYAITLNGGSVTINGASYTGSGVFSIDEFAANAEVEVVVKSGGSANNNASITLTEITLVVDENITTIFQPAAEGGNYTVDGTAVIESSYSHIKNAQETTTLSATPADGYKFFGWYSVTDETYLSKTANWTTNLTKEQTIRAVFAPDNAPSFQVGAGNEFFDLHDAVSFAQSSGEKTIVLVGDGILPAGEYTIPNGKTLLIPYNDAHTICTTEPIWNANDSSGSSAKAYKTLTMAEGANITVQSGGAISVSARAQNTTPNAGVVLGPWGLIQMEDGSNITVENGGCLYCYGFISGQGSVLARSGAKVYEDFQVPSFRGGNASSAMNGGSKSGVFPFTQYYIQNIEVPMTLEAGAAETVCIGVSMSYVGLQKGSGVLIGTNSGLFRIVSGSMTKWYDGATDRMVIEINGSAQISSMTVNMGSAGNIDSTKFVVPITNNMTVHLNSGSSLDIQYDLALLPGAVMSVDEGANLTLASGKNFYIYDRDEWIGKGFATNNTTSNFVQLTNVPGRTTKRTDTDLADAQIDVNGTFTVNGALYTTESGANITTSTGTGKIVLGANAGTAANTYQVTQSSNTVTAVAVPITPAQLQNADGSYAQTTGAAVNDVFAYREGMWHKTASDESVEHWPHTVVVDEAVAATCTATGLTEGSHCAICDKVLVEQEVVPVVEHIWSSDWNIDDENHWRACTVCGAEEEHAAHAPGEPTQENVQGATCTTPGSYDEVVYCSECGKELSRKFVTGEALGHSFTNYVSDGNATCTQDGTKTAKCDHCDETDTVADEGSKLPHTVVTDKAIDATCTEPGLTEGSHCSVCDTVIVAQTVLPATGHTKGAPQRENEVPATCTAPGSYDEVVYCTVCKEELSREAKTIPQLSHTLTHVERKEPACEEPGNIEYWFCDDCKQYFSDEEGKNPIVQADIVISATGHKWSEWCETTAPTCTTAGEETRYCANDASHTETRSVEKLGHDLTHYDAQEPTCTDFGWEAYDACSRCEYTTYQEIKALGHSYTGAVTEEADCENDGVETFTCGHCGDSYTKSIPATGHDYTGVIPTWSWEGNEEDGYTAIAAFACNTCGHAEEQEGRVKKEATDATCTQDGATAYTAEVTFEGIRYTDHKDGITISKTGHTYVGPDWIWNENYTAATATFVCTSGDDEQVVEATISKTVIPAKCEEDGSITYIAAVTFNGHGYTAEPIVEILEATGHTEAVDKAVAPTCEEPGLTEGSHCSVCGEVLKAQEEIPAIGHDYDDGRVTLEPTCTREGKIVYTCRNNEGHTYTEVLEKTPHVLTVVDLLEPTCTQPGHTAYDHCEACGEDFGKTELPATGHTYGEPSFHWNENDMGGWTAVAIFTCKTCGHEEKVNAQVTIHAEGEVEPTCTEPGSRTFTATVTFEEASYTDSRTVALAPKGHTEVTDPAKAPTCTETGLTEGKHCSVCGEVLLAQETVEALGHDYELTWIWTDGYAGATVNLVCKNDAAHAGSVEAAIESQTTPATYDAEGRTVYTATAVYEDVTYIDTKEVAIPQLTRPSGGGIGGSIGGGSTGGATTTPPITVPDEQTPNEEDLQDEETPLTEKPFLFEDVAETDWFYDAVKYVFDRDMMNGTSENQFSPLQTTSRGMIVTMLYRLEKEPGSTIADFLDVASDEWYTAAVGWGAPLGVVKGYGDGTFGPMDDITREQLAVFLFRYAEWKGYDVTGRDDLSNFGDAESVSGWALEAVQWAVSEGLLKGTNVGLNPLGNASRAEAAEVMFRFCEAHAETEEEAE